MPTLQRRRGHKVTSTLTQSSFHPEPVSFQFGSGVFKGSENGVYFIDQDSTSEDKSTWICSPLWICAKTRDAKSGSWGRLLEWLDDDGVKHTWAAPAELLQGDGTDIRKELARQGLSISTTRQARERLIAYIQNVPIEQRARCVDRLGWNGNVFITPQETIGDQSEPVVFQNNSAVEPAFTSSGSIEEWRDHIAALAAGNSRLVFAISVAFAGVLAEIAGEDSGGFHFRGGSSSGKTTCLKVAASVWGNPDRYTRVWRATANGLEGLATLHNDGVLILDELSQMNPKEAGECAYMLANGQGKSRAGRYGTARQTAQWRLLFLSAGEESLSAIMSKAGQQANAGQEVRMADIVADAGVGLGAFEVLHHCLTPQELSTRLKDASFRYHGTAGMEFLRIIVRNRAKLAQEIASVVFAFVTKASPKVASGQVGRVARRFGLVAVAGELATSYGLTGWDRGQSFKASLDCFNAWLDAFGTSHQEHRRIVEHACRFLEAHGASRFEDLRATSEVKTTNRVGFFRDSIENGREFLVLPQSFKSEFCVGFDRKTVIDALAETGMLIPGNNGPSQSIKIPALGGTQRVYVLRNSENNADDISGTDGTPF